MDTTRDSSNGTLGFLAPTISMVGAGPADGALFVTLVKSQLMYACATPSTMAVKTISDSSRYLSTDIGTWKCGPAPTGTSNVHPA